MRAPPRLRGGLAVRLGVLVGGLFVFSLGVVLQLESELGLSPWDVLHQGISKHTPLTFGTANVLVSACVLTAAWRLGARVGVGTAANAVLVGGFIELLTRMGGVQHLSTEPLGVRIALLALGITLCGIATALYLGAYLGAGPRDSLMVIVAHRTRFRISVVRGAIEVSALAAGFALGGKAGIGTLAFALAIGPAVEAACWLLSQTPLAAREPIPAVAARPARS